MGARQRKQRARIRGQLCAPAAQARQARSSFRIEGEANTLANNKNTQQPCGYGGQDT